MSSNRSRLIFFLLSLAVVLTIFSGSLTLAALDSPPEGKESLYKYLSVFTEVVNLVRRAYVEPTSIDSLMSGALDGTTDALDPFASFVPAARVPSYLAVAEVGERHSGLLIAKERGIAFAVAVAPGSPAVGVVEPGDILAQLAGRSTREMPLWEIRAILAGAPGTTVDMELLRRGEPHKVALELSSFVAPAPALDEVEGVRTLRISAFGPDTRAAVEGLLGQLAAQGADRLLIDLRGVGSGDPEIAYQVGGLFVQGPLGSLVGKSGALASFQGDSEPRFQGRLVVLVDRSVVGPAEVLARILRQGAKAQIVGQRTFGYAGRQAVASLADGSRLLLADGFYAGPDGEAIRSSLEPDLLVDDSSRRFGEKDVPIDELILRRGLGLLTEEAPAERKVA